MLVPKFQMKNVSAFAVKKPGNWNVYVWFWKNAYSWSAPIAGRVDGDCTAAAAVGVNADVVESSMDVESPVTQPTSGIARMAAKIVRITCVFATHVPRSQKFLTRD